MLAACTSDDDAIESVEESEKVKTETDFIITEEAIKERDDFIEAYNKIIDNSEESSDYILSEDIEDPKLDSEGDAFSQTLLSKEGKSISAVYKSDGTLNGYRTNEISEEGVPINTSFVTIQALNLDVEVYSEAYTNIMLTSESLNSQTYFDNGYKIFMTYAEVDESKIFTMWVTKDSEDISK